MVMISNHPLAPAFLRRAVYVDYQNDLRPSRFCYYLSHSAVAFEMVCPFLLTFVLQKGIVSDSIVILLFFFHLYILSNVPVGVPIEWNLMMMYQAFYIFYYNTNIPVYAVSQEPILMIFVLFWSVFIPIYGNIYPDRVSFLIAMRYYAGNWCWSMLLFTEGYEGFTRFDQAISEKKLKSVTTVDTRKPLRDLKIPETTIMYLTSFTLPFLMLHLPYRGIQLIISKYIDVDTLNKSYASLGEYLPMIVCGYNFGDGHMHGETIQRYIAEKVGFKKGEVYVIRVEGCPLFGNSHKYEVFDLAEGLLETCHIPVKDLLKLQPWDFK